MDKKQSLDMIRKATESYLELIQTNYPQQDIAEYTRLIAQLQQFLNFGYWSQHVEQEPIVLDNPEDIEKFLSILMDDSEPNEALKKAMERYKILKDTGVI